MLTALHHVQLAIPAGGEDTARAFWGDLLGMQEVAKPPKLARRGGCWFRSGTLEVHLGVQEPFRPATKAHPGILVDDLDAVVARLEEVGIEATPDDALPGHRRVHVDDPFGNRVELLASEDRPALPTTIGDLLLRRANAEDLPAILGLMDAGRPPADGPATDGPATAQPRPPGDTERRAFAALAANPGMEVIVVADDDRVVATMQVMVLPHVVHGGATRMQLESVHVAPDRRGHGIGSAMIRWAIDEADRRGCTRVQLTSNAGRPDAHRFYTRLGFEPTHTGFKLHLV